MSTATPYTKKPGIAKHATILASSSGSGADSDEEYGKIVEDKELKHPIIKKTLSKYGVSNEIVKKLSSRDDGDSDEEYGKPIQDPDLVPIPEKLQRPIVQTRSLSRYGSITIQKPTIENPRGDSDDEYGAVEEDFIKVFYFEFTDLIIFYLIIKLFIVYYFHLCCYRTRQDHQTTQMYVSISVCFVTLLVCLLFFIL